MAPLDLNGFVPQSVVDLLGEVADFLDHDLAKFKQLGEVVFISDLVYKPQQEELMAPLEEFLSEICLFPVSRYDFIVDVARKKARQTELWVHL